MSNIKKLASKDNLLRGWLLNENPRLEPVPGQLRKEETFLNNKSQMVFEFGEYNGKSTTERLLNVKDAFMAHSIGICVTKEDKTQPGIALPMSYVNPNVFPKTPNFEPSHLQGLLYNASLSIVSGTKVVVKNMDLIRFLKVPATQKVQDISLLGPDTSVVKQTILGVQDMFDISEIMQELEPYIMLAGEAKMIFTITLNLFQGAKIESKDDTNIVYKAVMMLFGMHLESGSGQVVQIAKNIGARKQNAIAQR